jgi:septum formation inhibitor MinC
MKQRADKFDYIANHKERETIQGIAQKFKNEVDEIKDDYEKANATLNVYAWVSYDEGYRKGLKELKTTADELSAKSIKIKKRTHGKFHYTTQEAVGKAVKLSAKRYRSKRQRKERTKFCKENGIEDTNEMFMLSMVMHTCFECGYLEANKPRNILKAYAGGDSEKEKMFVEIFEEVAEGLLV